MRLTILDNSHGFWTKVLFASFRAVSRLPVPYAVKLNRYRPEYLISASNTYPTRTTL